MGDTSEVGITFYDVPIADRGTVFDFLENTLQGGLGGIGVDEVEMGVQYSVDEMSLGWCSDEVMTLIDEAPGITVEASQANRYEFNGERVYHAPQLGTFVAETDGMGEIIVPRSTIDQVFNALAAGGGAPATALDFKRALDRRFGMPWIALFDALRAPGVQLKPPFARPEEEA